MIICDICEKDVTPDDEDEMGPNYSVVNFHGDKKCFCIDCESAISEWINSKECKKYCAEFKKQFEED